jgi:putative ABC transport system substrate-binding protein
MRGDDLPRIVQFVTAQRIPTVFELGRGVDTGGLMEFGPDLVAMAKQVGAYVDKLANGVKPEDLPVEEPTTFGLAVNLKAARSMGLEVPASLVMRATRVVE